MVAQPRVMDIQINIKPLSAAIAGLMVATMFFSYAECVSESNCPRLPKVPTISNTWEDPPGNFLSRVVVSTVALGMALLQPVFFKPLRSKLWKQGRVNIVLGVIACLGLSIVGAVCDSASDPECLGQNTLHTTSAVIFFILYNGNMVVLTKETGHPLAAAALAVVLTCTKARWLQPVLAPGLLGDETPLAIFEWTDVLLICGWTVWFACAHRPNAAMVLSAGLPHGRRAPPPDAAFFVSLRTLGLAATVLHTTNLVITLIAALADGNVPSGTNGTFPSIDSLWVSPPGNWLSRWSVPLAGSFAMFSHVLMCLCQLQSQPWPEQFEAASPKLSACVHRSKLEVVWHTFAVCGLLGLTIYGVANVHEAARLHTVGGGIFVVGYTIFMLGDLLSGLLMYRAYARTVSQQTQAGILPRRSLCHPYSLCRARVRVLPSAALPLAALAAAVVLLLPMVPALHGHPLGAVDPKVVAEWVFAVVALGYFSRMVLHWSGPTVGLTMKDGAAPQELLLTTGRTGAAPLLEPVVKQPTKA